MEAQHIHLLLNHFPIIGTLIAAALLTIGLLMQKTHVVTASLWMLVIFAIVAIPVYLTGEGAEEAIEHGEAAHDYIEAHEEAAGLAFYLMLGLGVVSLFTLVVRWRGMKYAKALSIITVLYAWAVFADMTYVGNIGGQISHPEIRKGPVMVSPATGTEEEGEEEQEHEHDHEH